MPKQKWLEVWQRPPIIGCLLQLSAGYLDWLHAKNYTPSSLATIRGRLSCFLTWCLDRNIAQSLNRIVRHYIKAAGIDKPGSCHLLRRTMATHMLANGAGIRAIQEILGHARLTATQVYTKLNIDKLKQVHASTHPASLDSEP